MKPSIGRVVHYTQPEDEKHFNGIAVHPAVITRVWSETCVNLKVFFDCGPVEDRTSVVVKDDGHSTSCWEWPSRVE